MSNGDYYVGRPECPVVAPETKDKQEPRANGEQKPVSTPGDYFIGRPASQEVNAEVQMAAEASPQQPPPQPADKKGPGFLAKCFPCFAPNGASE